MTHTDFTILLIEVLERIVNDNYKSTDTPHLLMYHLRQTVQRDTYQMLIYEKVRAYRDEAEAALEKE